LRLAGRASGRNALEWPSGRFAEHRGDGHIVVNPPPGVTPMSMSAANGRPPAGSDWGPFAPIPLAPHLPIGGELTYRFDGEGVDVDPSRFSTERTAVTFEGSTAWGDRSRFAFHVTSGDWQESDEVLAGILTDFGSKTGTVAVGGR